MLFLGNVQHTMAATADGFDTRMSPFKAIASVSTTVSQMDLVASSWLKMYAVLSSGPRTMSRGCTRAGSSKTTQPLPNVDTRTSDAHVSTSTNPQITLSIETVAISAHTPEGTAGSRGTGDDTIWADACMHVNTAAIRRQLDICPIAFDT
jgi:hypothetical protein